MAQSREYYRDYVARFRAKHGAHPMALWRRRNPDAAQRHRDEEARRRELPHVKRQHKAHNAKYRRALKVAAYEAYGGFRCRCCGETREPFLSLDHIKRDGNKHRAEIGAANLYRWLRDHDYPKGFRVFCMNCNFATRLGKRCPHKLAA